MKTCTLNNEKKAINELGADQLENVSGGYIYYNEETDLYEIINDKTWKTVISLRDYDSARACCLGLGFNSATASKAVVDYCRGLHNNTSEEGNA